MQPSFYDFQLSTHIVFGPGSLQELGRNAGILGRRALLVTGQDFLEKSGILGRIHSLLRSQDIYTVLYNGIKPEPSLDMARKGMEIFRSENLDLVIGVGGGSVLDVAKAVAGLAGAPMLPEDYFQGRPLEGKGFPLITIPTTAGSGAEVTINSVLTHNGLKQSIRSPYLAASLALVDPELTLSLPPDITAYTGMDALTQAIEAYTSNSANALTDIYAQEAILQIMSNLPKVYLNGEDIQGRSIMSLASLMAGIALTNARLGAVHGLAHSIGALSHKPHGLICAVLLPYVMRFNLAAVYEKYASIIHKMDSSSRFEDPIDMAAKFIKQIMHLKKKLGIPEHLRELGIEKNHFAAIIKDSLPSGSLKANPRAAGESELFSILEESW